jgi:hypothetical protein
LTEKLFSASLLDKRQDSYHSFIHWTSGAILSQNEKNFLGNLFQIQHKPNAKEKMRKYSKEQKLHNLLKNGGHFEFQTPF